MKELIAPALDRVAGKTCGSCGFFDPTALEGDPNLIEKIVSALNGGHAHRFVCHDGFPTFAGQHVPTPEQLQAAPLCAGFAALKAELEKHGAQLTSGRDQVALCREIIRRGQLASCITGK